MTKGEKQRHIYINNPKIILALNTHIVTMKKDYEQKFNYDGYILALFNFLLVWKLSWVKARIATLKLNDVAKWLNLPYLWI